MSMHYYNLIKGIRCDNVYLKFIKEWPKNIKSSQAWQLTQKSKLIIPEKYLVVRMGVSSRSQYEAFEKSKKAIDYIRGLWNYLINLTIPHPLFEHIGPVNKIVLGPFAIIENPDGTIERSYWVNHNFHYSDHAYPITENWLEFREKELKLRKDIDKLKYAEDIRKLIRYYADALDTIDLNTGFLRLYTVLENLSVSKGSDDLKSKSAFLWPQYRFQTIVLDHLVKRRNSLVHDGLDEGESIFLLYRIKRFVEILLKYHVSEGCRYSSLKEAAEYLGLHENNLENLEIKLENLEIKQAQILEAIKLRSSVEINN